LKTTEFTFVLDKEETTMQSVTQLQQLLEGYRLCCMAEGKSPATTRWYTGKLQIFKAYLKGNGFPTDVTRISTGHIRAFLAHLRSDVKADENNPNKPTRDQPLSSRTIQGYARTLKAFYSWLYREGYVNDNPMKLVKIPKASKIIVETLTERQIRRLLKAIDCTTPLGFRDRCIILILLDTGIRLSELAGLTINDVDLESGELKVTGKGQKQRLVPIGANVQKALWKYLNKYRPDPAYPSIDSLFLNRMCMPMSPDSIYRMIKRRSQKAGIHGVRCSPHTFRHTFAKNFLLNGGDVFTLQKILGHTSLEVVRMYVNLASDDVLSQHRKYSPVDVMGLKP